MGRIPVKQISVLLKQTGGNFGTRPNAVDALDFFHELNTDPGFRLQSGITHKDGNDKSAVRAVWNAPPGFDDRVIFV